MRVSRKAMRALRLERKKQRKSNTRRRARLENQHSELHWSPRQLKLGESYGKTNINIRMLYYTWRAVQPAHAGEAIIFSSEFQASCAIGCALRIDFSASVEVSEQLSTRTDAVISTTCPIPHSSSKRRAWQLSLQRINCKSQYNAIYRVETIKEAVAKL